MSKAENFINEHTKDCSNIFEGYYPNGKQSYFPWIHPKQARKAVEIAREEIYNWLANHYRDYMHNPTGEKLEAFFGMDMITDLKQAMKDENVK